MTDADRLVIACPSCATLNRVPAARLADGGHCGKCRNSLFPGVPVELTSQNFEKHAASSDIPLLIDFWAGWCGPCRQMAPSFAAVAAKVEPRLRLGTVDTEAERELSTRFAIQSIPSLVLVEKGRQIARTAGARPESALLQWLENELAARHRHFPDHSLGGAH